MFTPFGFNKSSHLCLRRDVDQLFAQGRKFTCYPFRIIYRQREQGVGVRLLIMARKRNFRHAVDRNRWRRLIREAYRLRQSSLHGLDLDICIIVIANDIMPARQVSERMQVMLESLRNHISDHSC